MRSTPDTERLAVADEDEELWLAQLLRPAARRPRPRAGHDAGLRRARSSPAASASTTPRPTQVKADQKDFFRLLYNLLVDADRGPRLPTLIVALGADKVRSLLDAPAADAPLRAHAPAVAARQVAYGRATVGAVSRAARRTPRGWSRAGTPSSAPTRRSRRCARAAAASSAEAAQEAAVGLVLPRHRAVALPAVAAQHVEAAVVADPGVGVDGHVVGAVVAGLLGERGPGERRRGVAAYDVAAGRVPAASSAAAGSSGRWVGGGPAIRSMWSSWNALSMPGC